MPSGGPLPSDPFADDGHVDPLDTGNLLLLGLAEAAGRNLGSLHRALVALDVKDLRALALAQALALARFAADAAEARRAPVHVRLRRASLEAIRTFRREARG